MTPEEKQAAYRIENAFNSVCWFLEFIPFTLIAHSDGIVMTPAAASAMLEEVRALEDDDEEAHRKEDAFRAAVLLAISMGAPKAPELAEIALRTKEIEFARWYA